MNKNGFTLVEVIGVIVILSILSLIAIPVIDRSLNKGKENLSKIQREQIIKSLRNYYAENLGEFRNVSTDSNNPTCKTVGELKNGYLPTDLNDPKTGERISEDLEVCVYKTQICESGVCNYKSNYFIKE